MNKEFMSTIDKIQGFSMIPKSFNFLSEYRDLMNLSFKDPFYDLDPGHKEKDWENIPFVIPKSIVILEKKLSAIQNWCKIKDKDIDTLLSNDFFKKLKADIETERKSDQQFRKNVEAKLTDLHIKVEEMIKDRDQRRSNKPKEESSTSYYDQFFNKNADNTKVNDDIHDHPNHDMKDLFDNNPQFCQLRKFSIKQLRHIIYTILNRSNIKYRLCDVEEKTKEAEKRVLDLYARREQLERRVDMTLKEIKEDIEKENDKVLEYIQEEIVSKMEHQKKLIETTVEEFDEIKKDIEENKGYREALNQKIDKAINRSNTFSNAFENKLTVLTEEVALCSNSIETKFTEYEDKIRQDINQIIKEFNDESMKNKEEFINKINEINKTHNMHMEDFKNNLVKTFHVLSYDTKKMLMDYKDDVTKHTQMANERVHNLDTKIKSFIEQFEDYSKTKIEPAFQNQAKIHIIETRLADTEQFHSSDSHFMRGILKKLIYAIQKFNLNILKNSREYEENINLQGSILSQLQPNTENQGQNTTNNIGILPETVTATTYFRPHSVPNLNPALRGLKNKQSKPVNGFIQVEGKAALNNTISIIQPEKQKEKSIKSKDDQNMSVMIDESLFIPPGTASKKQDNSVIIQEKNTIAFDGMLHKRLEHLRKSLLDTETLMSIAQQPKINSKKEALKAFKDIRLVKVDEGIKKVRNQSLNTSAKSNINEFGDGHLID